MPTSLRLPPGLEANAKVEASRLGLSLNGLMCVALDFYLSQRVQYELANVEPEVVAVPAPSVVIDAPKVLAAPSKTGHELLSRQNEGYTLTKPEKAILRAWRESQRGS